MMTGMLYAISLNNAAVGANCAVPRVEDQKRASPPAAPLIPAGFRKKPVERTTMLTKKLSAAAFRKFFVRNGQDAAIVSIPPRVWLSA